MKPLVVLDADVLGRRRTGDESYVENLLRELPGLAPDLRFAAITRQPELVPDGVEPIELQAASQITRMAFGLPQVLRRLGPQLGHFLHALPLRAPRPAVLTIQDVSYLRRELMGLRDRAVFRASVPRSLRKADRILVPSEWTRAQLLGHHRVPSDKIVVIPDGVDPAYGSDGQPHDGPPYALFVGALQPRKDPVTAIEALALVDGDLRLLLVGPDKGGEGVARRAVERLGLERRVDFLGYVGKEELASLYRGAACFVFPSRYEGFGLPILEAMASATPVVASSATSIPEVSGKAAVLVEPGDPVALAGGIERALADRERLVEAGLARVQLFSWAETARRTLAVYRELL